MTPFVCIASGPSLTLDDCNAVKHLPVIVINTSYVLAPWADYLYACDIAWWDTHIEDVRESFTGEMWTQSDVAANKYQINHIKSERKPGLSRVPGVIHQGANSGYQAINLAYHFGAKKIILLGYDMMADKGRNHWHAEHKGGASNAYSVWVKNYDQLARDLKDAGVQVVNCSRRTALRCFPYASLDSVS